MGRQGESTGPDLLRHVLLPVATEGDAAKTAQALLPYDPDEVTAVHVVEKGEGVPDKKPVAQSLEIAEDCYAAVRSIFPDANSHTAYARDIVTAIFDAANEAKASCIAFRPRGGSRLTMALTGDHTHKLVTENDRPVLVLPSADGGG